jgi:hypothetical protein
MFEESQRDGDVQPKRTKLFEVDRLEYEVLKDIYQSLLAKREESRMAADMERQQIGEQFKVLDPARIPEKPVSPDRGLIMEVAAGVGLALGLVGLFVRRKRLPADPDAPVVSPARYRLAVGARALVFALLSALLLYQIAILP